MERILIVGVNWFGDALMLTPAPRALKEQFPSSYVAVMVVQRVREIFEDNPYVDEVIVFDEKKDHRRLKDKYLFIRQLKKKKFDTVFLVHRSFTRALVCYLAGIPQRIGYRRFKNACILTKKIPPPGACHRQDYYLNLFEQSGVAFRHKHPQFFLSDNARKNSRALVQSFSGSHQYIVGIHVAANWQPKRWPVSRFAELSDRLMQDLGALVVLTGSAPEQALTDEVIGRMHMKPSNLCAKTTLKQLAAVMEQMNCFVSADSGPAHLAAAVGIATVVLFGPTSEALTAPRGKRVITVRNDNTCHIPCYQKGCSDNICMTAITVDEVYEAVRKVLMYE